MSVAMPVMLLPGAARLDVKSSPSGLLTSATIGIVPLTALIPLAQWEASTTITSGARWMSSLIGEGTFL